MVDSEMSWLGAVLAKRERDDSIVKIISMETEPASKTGDNYASVIVRATLKVVLGSGKVTTKRVILKKSLPNIPQDLVADMSGAFVIEGLAYEKILAPLETIRSENCLSYSKFWPDCYHASTNVLVFEDLRATGFTLGCRQKGLDLAHAKLVFTNLARLHSLSVVALANGTVFKKTTPPYLMSEPGIGENFFRVSMRSLADVMRDSWGPEWTAVENKIRFLMNEIIPILGKLYNEPHKLNVMNHGDCWVNNMMFKYDADNSPTELKFVDFQLCHYNSYSWDLTYFLHSSIHPKNLESWEDQLIEIYSKEFTENLARVNFDTSVAPTVDDIKNELTRLRPFSVAVSTSILPITANPSNIKIELDEMVNEESNKFKEFFEDKEFDPTLKTMMNRFVKLDAFSNIN